MLDTVQLFFQSTCRARSPAIDGYSHRFHPGNNRVPRDHIDALIGKKQLPEKQARQAKFFFDKWIATGKLRETNAPPPVLQAPVAQLPASLTGFAEVEAIGFIQRANNQMQIQAWAANETRPAIQQALMARWKQLQPR